MGYAEAKKQNQQEDEDESELDHKWVQCPDIPDELLTVDDETPYKIPKKTTNKEDK